MMPAMRSVAFLGLFTASFLAAALALPLAADPHPNVAIGLSPDKSYQIGDVDNVNLFNGALTVTIPLGPSYPLGGNLSYQLTLVRNSNPWFVLQTTDSTQTIYNESLPSTCSNAGLGWRVSFGELDPYCSPSDFSNHVYQDPSGADHVFYPTLHDGETAVAGVFYTRDGTYLRLQWSDPTAELDFPDGTVRSFQKTAVVDPVHPTTVLFYRWRMVRLADPFNNWMQVSYGASAWTITDSLHRTQTVNLRSDLWAGSPYYETISSVALAAFGGGVATYQLNYLSPTIARACPAEDPNLGNGVPVAVLASLVLPDGSTYSMAAADNFLPAPQGSCVEASGELLGMTLPTLGRIEWSYMAYHFPNPASDHPKPWRMSNQGVATRTTKNEQGAVLGAWTYTTSLSPPPFPGAQSQELVNSVTDPLGQRTVRYFSVDTENVYVGWNGCDYGLPFTRNVSIGSSPLYLSSQTFRSNGGLFRSEYVRYERDQTGLCAGGVEDLDRRVAAARTVYEDDGGTYAETDSSGFDGLGHYRTATTAGSFPAGNARTHVTNYNPSAGTYTVTTTGSGDTVSGGFVPLASTAPWILGTWSYQDDQENGVTGSFVESCYNQTTGFLSRRRIHQSTGAPPSVTDVVVDFTPDAGGNVLAEKSFGGDVQKGILAGNVCGFTPGSGLPVAPEYEIDYTYQNGVRSTAKYAAAPFYSLNQQIDASTGLAMSSTDTTGVLTTTYSYDAMGRLTREQPAQEAATVYAYTPANPTTRALAGLDIQRQSGGGTKLAERMLVFDALGRVYHETQKLADGSFNVRETLYDGAGNKSSVSELQAGNAVQKTQFLSYDPAGRVTLIRPADSTSANGFAHDVTVTYAGARSVTRTVKVGQTLAGGAVAESPSSTTEIYDRQGRLYQVIEPSGAAGANVTTTYGYDVGNRLASVSTTSGGVTQTRTFTYDQRGFLSSETHPEKVGAVQYFSYDSRGHAQRKVDGANDLTYAYDFAERPLLIRQTGAGFTACNQLSGPLCYKLWSYAVQNGTGDYKNGKLFQSVRYNYPVLGGTQYQAFITETYHYGGVEGRVSQRDTQLTFALYGQPPVPSESFTESFVYDPLGDTSSITYPTCTFSACTGKDVPRTVSFTHTNGFLTAVTGTATIGGMPSASTYASAITYWPNLLVAQVTHGNGVVDTQANDPNAMRRPQSITATVAGSTLWKTDGYVYDGAGNVTQIGAGRFLYDRVSRLTSGSLPLDPQDSTMPVTQTYAFDAFGNLQSIGGADARVTPTSSATNRLNGAGTTYDAAGNLTAWNGATYEYDGLNQLKHYVDGSQEWLYIYDADDERLWSYQPGIPGTSVRFDRWTLRDLAGKVLRTYEASGYNWTGSDVEDTIYRDGLLLAAELPNSGAIRHFHLDHLGTPRLITDQNHSQVAYHAYFPFGEEATAFNQDAERMKFTGHERDLASTAGAGDDLDYMHARHESPVTGRFLSVDTGNGELIHPLTWNRYFYGTDNPLKNVDRNGQNSEEVLGYMNALVSDLALGLGRIDSPNNDFQRGQNLGDQAAQKAGAVLTVVGLPTAGVSLAAEGPSAGASTVTAIAGGVAAVAGISALLNSGIHLAESTNGSSGGEERNAAQDKKLSSQEIDKLKDAGIDVHKEKYGKNTGQIDLYKDSKGNVYIKAKGGTGPGEPLYINLNNLPTVK